MFWFLKNKFFYVFAIFTCLSFASLLHAADLDSEDGQNSSEKKQTHSMPDPAAKRGFELGYDAGVKIGKEDKKLGKKPSAPTHEEYKNADKNFRAEYGNRSRFTNGYQSGFIKGYKRGYDREKAEKLDAQNKKKKEKSLELDKKNPSTEKNVSLGDQETHHKKLKHSNPSEDAL